MILVNAGTWGVKVLSNKKIDNIVETICQKGCQAVRDDIALLKCGKKPVETNGLNRAERRAVYKELKSIMAVYGDSCRVDGDIKIRSPRRRRIVNNYLRPAFPES